MKEPFCHFGYKTSLDNIYLKDLPELFQKYPQASPENLISLLQDIQQEYGYLSQDNMLKVAKYLEIPPSKVYGVATFYNQFKLAPQGRHVIQVCRGTACHVKGSKEIVDKIKQMLNVECGNTTDDGKFFLEEVVCLGACSIAPIVVIDGTFYGHMNVEKVSELLGKFD